MKLSLVSHTCNPSSGAVETGGSFGHIGLPVWHNQWVPSTSEKDLVSKDKVKKAWAWSLYLITCIFTHEDMSAHTWAHTKHNIVCIEVSNKYIFIIKYQVYPQLCTSLLLCDWQLGLVYLSVISITGVVCCTDTLGQPPCHYIRILQLCYSLRASEFISGLVNEMSSFVHNCCVCTDVCFCMSWDSRAVYYH